MQDTLDKAFEALYNERSERLQENNEFRLKENDRKLIEKMIDLAPSLINNMTGKDIFPQGTADASLLNAIADDLTAEKIQALQQVIDPKLWPLLVQRFQVQLKKRAAEEQAKKAAQSNGQTQKNDEKTEAN